MTTEHRENRSLPIRTAVEPASLLPLSAHMSYGQMRMALYNVAPDLQVSPRGLRTFSWRPNGKIFVCSVLRNESVRWSCISPRR